MVSKGASIPLQIDCGWWTRPGPEQPDGNPYHQGWAWSGLFCTTILWRASRNVSICWLLYGPSFAWWCRSPRRLMAAHNVIFPPRCPGTCTIALWPITLRPRRLVLLRSNPASSMKMNSWGCAAPSMAKILCNKKTTTYYYSATHTEPPPHHTGTCVALRMDPCGTDMVHIQLLLDFTNTVL